MLCFRKDKVMSIKNLQSKFDKLAIKWKEETMLLSNMQSIVKNKHYVAIVELGPEDTYYFE